MWALPACMVNNAPRSPFVDLYYISSCIVHVFVAQSMWTTKLYTLTSRSKNYWHSPAAASTLLWRLSIRFLNLAAGIFFHSATKALMRSTAGVVQCCLLLFQRLRSGLCAGKSSSWNHFVWISPGVQGQRHVETGKSLPRTVATQLEGAYCLKR